MRSSVNQGASENHTAAPLSVRELPKKVKAHPEIYVVESPAVHPHPSIRMTYTIVEKQPAAFATVRVYFADGSEGRALWNGVDWWTIPMRDEKPIRWAEL